MMVAIVPKPDFGLPENGSIIKESFDLNPGVNRFEICAGARSGVHLRG
jgi:hypothetical protein